MTRQRFPGPDPRGHPSALDEVDASSDASFPASDPPSWWAGAALPAPVAIEPPAAPPARG